MPSNTTTSDDYAQSIALLYPEMAPGPDEEDDGYLDEERLTVAERRAKTARLYQRGRTMRQIMVELKVSIATVQRDIHAVLEGWRRYAKQHIAELIVKELARLAHREADIEIEWEKSKGEQIEKATGRRALASGGSTDTAAVKTKQRCGDAKLAALLVKCWELRCRLLGMLKPEDMAARANELPPVKFVAGLDPVETV